MITTANKQRGFTIVELLIVIVVIAILATITIVSFGGIQARAENTKTVTAVKEYAKAMQIYAAYNGTYPVVSYSCLGVHPGTTCGNLTDFEGPCFGGQASSRATFDTMMKEVISSAPPQPSDQVMSCGGKQYSGAWYYSPDGRNTLFTFYLRGDVPCDNMGLDETDRMQEGDATVCQVRLPPL